MTIVIPPCFLEGNDKKNKNVYFILGKSAIAEGDLPKARFYFEFAYVEGVDNADFVLGYLEEKLGEFDRANFYYMKAIEAGNLNAYYSIGSMEYRRNNIVRAKEYLQKASELGVLSAYRGLDKLIKQDVEEKKRELERKMNSLSSFHLLLLGPFYLASNSFFKMAIICSYLYCVLIFVTLKFLPMLSPQSMLLSLSISWLLINSFVLFKWRILSKIRLVFS